MSKKFTRRKRGIQPSLPLKVLIFSVLAKFLHGYIHNIFKSSQIRWTWCHPGVWGGLKSSGLTDRQPRNLLFTRYSKVSTIIINDIVDDISNIRTCWYVLPTNWRRTVTFPPETICEAPLGNWVLFGKVDQAGKVKVDEAEKVKVDEAEKVNEAMRLKIWLGRDIRRRMTRTRQGYYSLLTNMKTIV